MSAPLNPDTYLNHLPPTVAAQFEVARNVTIATLGVIAWDIFLYIPDDIRIVRQSPFRLVSLCFMSTRIFATIFVVLSIIRQTVPVEDCHGVVNLGMGIICCFANLTSSFLFLQRLRAVYASNRWVQSFFFVLWLTENGFMTTAIYGAELGHIPGTKYCTYTEVQPYISATGFMVAFFDTTIFLAISYKVATSHADPSIGVTWDTIVSGRALPRISRAVLQGGQQYYLITTCLSIPLAFLILLPAIPATYRPMLSFPFIALTASMACRVFRNLKLQSGAENEVHSAPTPEVNFATRSYTHDFVFDTGEPRQPIPKSQDYESATCFELHDVPPRKRVSEHRTAEVRPGVTEDTLKVDFGSEE